MGLPSPRSATPFPGWSPGFQAALERLTLVARRPSRGHHAGAVRSLHRGRALEFADFRPYVPGDDPRLVDWRTYARLGRLYLKQYDEERSRTLTLLLDASASLDWGDDEAHKGRYARRLAAALGWIALSHHEPTRAFLLRDGSAQPLPPAATKAGVGALFRALANVAEAGRTDLAAAVERALAAPARGPVVLLSDLLDPTWPAALRALAAADEGVVLQVLAPAEWEPPLGEEVELEDVETGALLPTRLGPAELAAYRAQLQRFLEAVRGQASRLGLLHVALNTGAPLQDAVFRHLVGAGVLA